MPTVNGDFPNLNSTEITEADGLRVERGEIPANDVIMIDSAEETEVSAAPADGAVVYVDGEAAAVTLTVEAVPPGTRVTVINDGPDAAGTNQITLEGGANVNLAETVLGEPGAVVELIHVRNGEIVATGDLA